MPRGTCINTPSHVQAQTETTEVEKQAWRVELKNKVLWIAKKKEHTSMLKTTISPARTGSLLICKNKMSPCKTIIKLCQQTK